MLLPMCLVVWGAEVPAQSRAGVCWLLSWHRFICQGCQLRTHQIDTHVCIQEQNLSLYCLIIITTYLHWDAIDCGSGNVPRCTR